MTYCVTYCVTYYVTYCVTYCVTYASSKLSFNFLHTFWAFITCIYILKYILKNCHQHSYGFQILMSSWGWGSKFSNLQQVGDFSILGSKSSLVQGVILKIILALVFNFRLGTYKFPSGSSATSLTTRPKAEFWVRKTLQAFQF